MKAIITHFDGDPFILGTWLKLYAKYWRGEVDTIFMSIFYKPEIIPEEVLTYLKELLSQFPEIKVTWLDSWKIPEVATKMLYDALPQEYDKVGFVESDGLIYGKGAVATCFNLLDEGQDIVAPEWRLIDNEAITREIGTTGFMRCFFFAKRSVLQKIQFDLMPKELPAGYILGDLAIKLSKELRLDCFGWISLQLGMLKPKWTKTMANLVADKPDWETTFYNNFPWLHIRQMSSSALGIGGGEYGLWSKDDDKMIVTRVFDIFNEDLPNGGAEFTYVKAVAFRLLFWDAIAKENILNFANEYKLVLDLVTDYYNLPIKKIYEFKGFFKGLMQI